VPTRWPGAPWTATGWTGGTSPPTTAPPTGTRSIWAEPAVINRRIEAALGPIDMWCACVVDADGRCACDSTGGVVATGAQASGVGRRPPRLRRPQRGPTSGRAGDPSQGRHPPRRPDPGRGPPDPRAHRRRERGAPLTRQRAISTDSILTPTRRPTSQRRLRRRHRRTRRLRQRRSHSPWGRQATPRVWGAPRTGRAMGHTPFSEGGGPK